MTDSSGSRRFLSRRPDWVIAAAVPLLFAGFMAGFAAAVVVWQVFGGGVWRSEVSVVGAQVLSPDGDFDFERLVLIVDSCEGNPHVTLLRETDVDVQVKVVASSTPLRGGCDGLDTVEVPLQEPLGGRVVVDRRTGQSLSVSILN
ncbi:MAG: hypothetical protein WD208_08010 [Dehalococcoidia bacterium]